MELRLLDYFTTLCKHLHFTNAAEELRITQPTLSHQIKLLEDQVGMPLFERAGRKIFITPAGQELLLHSKRIFLELEQFKLKIDELKGIQRGKLTIGCSGTHFLTNPIINFNNLHPNIDLSVHAITTEEAITKIINNELDLSIVFIEKFFKGLESQQLFEEEFFLTVSRNHELSKLDRIALEQLASVNLALLPKNFFIRQFIDSLCEKQAVYLNPKIELSSLYGLTELIQSNEIATILPKSFLVTIDMSNLKAIQITDPNPVKTLGLIYRKNALVNSTLLSFVNHLKSFFNTY